MDDERGNKRGGEDLVPPRACRDEAFATSVETQEVAEDRVSVRAREDGAAQDADG